MKTLDTETIVVMREAIEVLKQKWKDAQGAWGLVEFFGAAEDPNHWMHIVVKAERLSEEVWQASGKAIPE